MNKSLSYGVMFGLLMFWSGPALAGVSLAITDDLGDPGEVAVLPDSSFVVEVELDTTESLISGQLMIQASASDIFTLDAISFDGLIWSTDPDDILDPTPEALTLANSNTSGDIGTLAVDVDNGTGVGIMDFVSIQVSVDESALEGLYTLQIVEPIFGDVPGDEVESSVGDPYEVTVIPLPAGLMLGLLGMGLVGWKRKRRVI